MIGINCLLRNTHILKNIHDLVEYMGYDRMANGKDPSVGAIYSDLRKAGVEVDLRTVGEVYKNALSHQDERFTQAENVNKITGRETEATLRNLMLQKPIEGEQQIGKQSPEEFIANGLMRTFHSNIVEDVRTKSIMRELQDAAYKEAQRQIGELPNKNGAPTPEHFSETVQKALELDNKGYNTLEGTLNNAHTLFEGMKAELAKRSAEINGSHDHLLVDQWNDYVKSLEDATYSLLLSKEQAKNVLYGSLKEAGYAKELKSGKTILDWNKLAGNVNDIGQLRSHVRSVMEAQGYDPGTAIRIADALQKEYIEIRGKVETHAKMNYDKLQQSWDTMPAGQKKEFDVNTLVNKRLGDWENFKKLTGNNGQPLMMTKGEATQLISEALKNEGYGKRVAGGKMVLDWTKLAVDKIQPTQIDALAGKMLAKKGYGSSDIQAVTRALQAKYTEVRQDILDHAKTKLDAMQDKVQNPVPLKTKTDIERLSELHSLGIFNGAHDDLLNHVAGMSAASRHDISALANIGKIAADLSRELNGKNYLAAPVFQELQRQVNSIIGRNISNKSMTLKVAGAISHFFQLENMGIIGNAFNLLENNLSGAKEMLAANMNLMQKVGYENAFKDGKLLKSTWQNIAAGGAEYGDEPGRFGHHDFVTDRFNIKDINKNTLKDPKQYGKVMATVIVAPAKAYLNGSDGAFKASIHKKTMALTLHKALVENGIPHEEASHMLNEALYGQSLEDARRQASNLLNKYGLRNTKQDVERLANNLVIQNLNSDGRFSHTTTNEDGTVSELGAEDVVEAAYKSSYHTASLGMGHAANNPFSRMLLASKAKAINEENQLIKQEKWGLLAYHRINNTVWHNGIFRFMGGGANWGVLRLQSGFGMGLITGYLGKLRGANELNFDSREKLQDTMLQYSNAQREIHRAVVGLGYLAANVGMVYAYGALRDKKEGEPADESTMQSAYAGINANYVGKRLLTKVGADGVLFDFLAHTSKAPKHGYFDAAYKYVQNNFNIGNSFSAGGELMQAGEDVRHGEKGYLKAKGDIGQIVGNMVEVPFYRSYKGAGMLIDYAFTGADPKPKFQSAYGVFEGLLGGGMFEDLGLYQRNSTIMALPGIGDKAAQKAAEDGIKTIDDLKNHAGWLDDNLSGKSLEKAQAAYDKVYGGNKGINHGTAGGGAGGKYQE